MDWGLVGSDEATSEPAVSAPLNDLQSTSAGRPAESSNLGGASPTMTEDELDQLVEKRIEERKQA